MRRFNTIIESANPPGINQLWIDKKKLRYFAEGKWQLLTGGGGGSSEPPEISNHDTWIIDGVDTGRPSRGEKGAKGDNGLTPYINGSGNWQIGLVDTGVRAAGIDGQNGLTPYINTDKNWWIGTTNTGIKAEGKDGTDGTNGTNGTNGLTPFIGVNKNWWIGSTDTGTLAEGKDGINGTNGTDGAAAGIEEAYATAESVSNNAPAEVTVMVTGPDTAKIFTFHFKIPKGKDGSGGGGTGVDGKTPILQIGNVTTVAPSGQATANVRYTSDDPDGNPIYAIDFGIPSGVKGDDGTDGIDGKTPVFEIGTVETLPAGSSATVAVVPNGTDVSGNPKYKINFGIPKGADGAAGTTDYNDLTNKPKIGTVELSGTKSLADLGIQPEGDYATEEEVTSAISAALTGYATQTYVNTQIQAAIGVINTTLDEINGEVI